MSSKLPEGWKKVKLVDVFSYRSGLSKGRKYFGEGYPFLTFKDIFYNYFVPEKLTELVMSTEKERKNISVQKGDVFLTRTSETFDELGMSSVALKDYPNATFNGFTKRLRPLKNDLLNNKYSAYYFRSKIFRDQIDSIATMTTRASLNNSMLDSMYIIIPPLPEQNAIASTLSALDDKIELNNKINENLEAQAQALFKYWFVDFEFPDENGNPYKSSGGAMVESELGMIPKGWEVVEFGDIINIKNGKRPKVKMDNKDSRYIYPILGASGVMGYTNDYIYDEPILVIGRVGTHGIVQKTISKAWTSDNTMVIKTPYYELANQILSRIDYTSLNRGSTQPLLSQKDIKNQSIIIPKRNGIIMNKFEEIIGRFREKIFQLEKQNQTLSQLRDILLPKLMSGKIRISLES